MNFKFRPGYPFGPPDIVSRLQVFSQSSTSHVELLNPANCSLNNGPANYVGFLISPEVPHSGLFYSCVEFLWFISFPFPSISVLRNADPTQENNLTQLSL